MRSHPLALRGAARGTCRLPGLRLLRLSLPGAAASLQLLVRREGRPLGPVLRLCLQRPGGSSAGSMPAAARPAGAVSASGTP